MNNTELIGMKLKDLEDDQLIKHDEELLGVLRAERPANLVIRLLGWVPFIGQLADMIGKAQHRTFAIAMTDTRLMMLRLTGPFFAETIKDVTEHQFDELKGMTLEPGRRHSTITIQFKNGQAYRLQRIDSEAAVAFVEEYRCALTPERLQKVKARREALREIHNAESSATMAGAAEGIRKGIEEGMKQMRTD